jgi:hypothetical protein
MLTRGPGLALLMGPLGGPVRSNICFASARLASPHKMIYHPVSAYKTTPALEALAPLLIQEGWRAERRGGCSV